MKSKSTKKTYPKEIIRHYEQMVNTIKMLQIIGLAKEYIRPNDAPEYNEEGEYIYKISWKNNVGGVNEKIFSSLDAYCKIVSKRSYQIVLFDNSIVRCAMCFDSEGILKSQNFAYVPCPIDCFSDENISIDDIVEMINVGLLESNKLLMRTTVRFDYDSSNDSEEHPANHVHLQSPGTRISTNGSICFNRFIKHIIEVFYPKSYFYKKGILTKNQYEALETLEFIDIKKEDLPVKKYSSSSIYHL